MSGGNKKIWASRYLRRVESLVNVNPSYLYILTVTFILSIAFLAPLYINVAITVGLRKL